MNEKELTHIDLFSGIGGFALAAEWAGFKTIVFCENEPFCQKVLCERFGGYVADSECMRKLQSERGEQKKRGRSSNSGVPIIPNIRDFDGTEWRGATLLTGGFPCQPFSVAGQQGGREDNRYLWPEMFRVIKEAKPTWVIAENVTGIIHMALGQVLSDLESIGYDFPRDLTGQAIVPIIPASAVNAPHQRKRVWIIAHTRLLGQEKHEKQTTRIKQSNQNAPDPKSGNPRKQAEQEGRQNIGRGSKKCDDSDSTMQGFQESQEGEFKESLSHAERNNWESSNAVCQHDDNGRYGTGKNSRKLKKTPDLSRGEWQIPWLEVAASFCRVDDGISDRIHRLKALGNAIVPQIAYEIIKYIKEIEKII